MFSPQVVESDAFLDMSLSAQALYFHLGMHADDDGFVNPRKYVRMLGNTDDDLKVLVGKRFLIPSDNGVVVVKHWRMNNYIRKDRYTPTVYLEERSHLRIKDNMAYTLDENQGMPFDSVPWLSDADARSTNGQPTVDPGKVRLGKVTREDKSSKSKKK